jgi:hypothetical protein
MRGGWVRLQLGSAPSGGSCPALAANVQPCMKMRQPCMLCSLEATCKTLLLARLGHLPRLPSCARKPHMLHAPLAAARAPRAPSSPRLASTGLAGLHAAQAALPEGPCRRAGAARSGGSASARARARWPSTRARARANATGTGGAATVRCTRAQELWEATGVRPGGGTRRLRPRLTGNDARTQGVTTCA